MTGAGAKDEDGAQSVVIAAQAGAGAPSDGPPLQRSLDQLHRARLIQAVVEVCDEDGLAAASVARVIARAACSRRTFYGLFADRDACLLAALEHTVARAAHQARAPFLARRQWPEKTRAGLFALLQFFDEEPQLARVCFVFAPGGSPSLLGYRAAIVRELAQIVDGARSAGSYSPPPLTAQALVGGILEILRDRVAKIDKEPLVSLLQPLMAMIMLPYFGEARSSQELERPLPALPGRARAVPRDPMPRPPKRLTWRTMLTLYAVAFQPGMSNRAIADAAGIADEAQISKLLSRLQRSGLVHNSGIGQARGGANSWQITEAGSTLVRHLRAML